jgi:hypothetical protein
MPGYPAPAPCSYFAIVTLMTSILRPKEVAPEARPGCIGIDPVVGHGVGTLYTRCKATEPGSLELEESHHRTPVVDACNLRFFSVETRTMRCNSDIMPVPSPAWVLTLRSRELVCARRSPTSRVKSRGGSWANPGR